MITQEKLRAISFAKRDWEHHYLSTQMQQNQVTLGGYTSGVTTVSFSPDGKRLASASSDNTVKLWDATTGQEMLTDRTSVV